MPNNAGTVPTFSGKTSLSLSDLDALSAAVKSFHGTEYVPAGGHRGQRRYRLANFNLDQVNEQGHDVFSNEGLVRAVGFSVEDEPYIRQGDIVLPVAHYVPGSAEDEPAATGALSSVLVEGGISAPDIQRGQMRLPLADSTECGGAVAGLIQAVQVDDEATGPFISQGVLHLTEAGGCSCVPAEYTPGGDECSGSVLGLIRSIDPNDNIQRPDIVDGAIRLPYADTARGAHGLMQGVQVVEGYPEPLICYGHLFLPLADTCSGATGLMKGVTTDATTSPYIADGVLHLTDSACSCVPAEYNDSTSTLGLIRSIDPNSNIQLPDIVDGAIRLPYADTERGAHGLMQGVQVVEGYPEPLICYGHLFLPLANTDVCSGAVGLIAGIEQCAGLTSPTICAGVITIPAASAQVAGLRDMYGNPINWADIYTDGAQQTALAQFTAGGTTLTLCANFSDGYLNFEFRA